MRVASPKSPSGRLGVKGFIPSGRPETTENRCHGLWRSLVAHLTGGQGVAGSNPVIPTNMKGSAERPALSCCLMMKAGPRRRGSARCAAARGGAVGRIPTERAVGRTDGKTVGKREGQWLRARALLVSCRSDARIRSSYDGTRFICPENRKRARFRARWIVLGERGGCWRLAGGWRWCGACQVRSGTVIADAAARVSGSRVVFLRRRGMVRSPLPPHVQLHPVHGIRRSRPHRRSPAVRRTEPIRDRHQTPPRRRRTLPRLSGRRGGYRLDFAVRHPDFPGRHVLAIEADGAAYHSGHTARERDRLRQELLERRGWTFHRIWSTDWFNDADREVRRALTAYEEALRLNAGSDRASAPAAPKVWNEGTTERKLPRPLFKRREQITDYSMSTLIELVRYIRSDDILRSREEEQRLLLKELGYSRLGSRIQTALSQAQDLA